MVRHEYLRAIYEDDAQEVVLYKAGQMGVSEYLISYAMHACDQRAATVLYVFPTDGHVSDFSAARLGPAIEASPYLTSIIVDGGAAGGKRGSDKVTLKRVRNRYLYFRGGHVKVDGSAPGLKSVDADVVVIDEVDECDARVPGIVDKRLGHSLIKEKRLASTPTYPGRGIHADYLRSDRRQWFIPCPHCRHRQTVTIRNVVLQWDDLERPVAWHEADGRPFAACEHCGRPLDLGAPGEWVAEVSSPVAGYHIKKFFSPALDLPAIIRNLQSTDETVRKETYNQDLAETYTPRGGALTDTELDAVTRDYGHGPQPAARCFMGIDVGKVLHVVIRTAPHSESGERRQLFAGEVGWDDLKELVARYNPAAVVMDALPETKKAREFQAAHRHGLIWLCYYQGTEIGTKTEDSAAWNHGERIVNADRTRTLDEMFSRFYEGKNTLPANAKALPRYYDQLKAPVRVLRKNAKHQEVAAYIETGPDHYAHAENYCCIASGSILSTMASSKKK